MGGNNRRLLSRHTQRPYYASTPQTRMDNCERDVEYSSNSMGNDFRNDEENLRFMYDPRALTVCPNLYSHRAYPPGYDWCDTRLPNIICESFLKLRYTQITAFSIIMFNAEQLESTCRLFPTVELCSHVLLIQMKLLWIGRTSNLL